MDLCQVKMFPPDSSTAKKLQAKAKEEAIKALHTMLPPFLTINEPQRILHRVKHILSLNRSLWIIKLHQFKKSFSFFRPLSPWMCPLMSKAGCPPLSLCFIKCHFLKNLKNFYVQWWFILTFYIWLAAEDSPGFKRLFTSEAACTWENSFSMCACQACARGFICMFLKPNRLFCLCLCDWGDQAVCGIFLFYLTVHWFTPPHSYSKCCSLVCVTTQLLCYLTTAATP